MITEPRNSKRVVNTASGKAQILIDRVIARLGATAPRSFVEACGVTFPNKDPASVPAISSQYESNVKGLYIVGALGGYPLIKQAMNQGYEVVEYILGEKVPAQTIPSGYNAVFEQAFLRNYQDIAFGRKTVKQAVDAFFSEANASLGKK